MENKINQTLLSYRDNPKRRTLYEIIGYEMPEGNKAAMESIMLSFGSDDLTKKLNDGVYDVLRNFHEKFKHVWDLVVWVAPGVEYKNPLLDANHEVVMHAAQIITCMEKRRTYDEWVCSNKKDEQFTYAADLIQRFKDIQEADYRIQRYAKGKYSVIRQFEEMTECSISQEDKQKELENLDMRAIPGKIQELLDELNIYDEERIKDAGRMNPFYGMSASLKAIKTD